MSETGRMLLADLLERTHCGSYLRSAQSLSGLVVLNYHRIGTSSSSPFDRGLWSATDHDFDRQLEFLKSNFDIILPQDLPQAIHQSRQRSIMITFDDGYRDNYESAFRILQHHQIPAVFFLSTGFLDRPHISWWDEIAWMVRTTPCHKLSLGNWGSGTLEINGSNDESVIRRLLRIYKNLPDTQTLLYLQDLSQKFQTGRAPESLARDMWMTWDMVREMHRSGMVIGAHTVTHPVLARLDPKDQSREIHESCRRIASELRTSVEAFSFPVGGPTAYNSATLQALRDAGVRWAFTYGFGGYVRDSHLPYEIPRLPVESDLNLTRFRALTTLPGLFS